MSQKLDAMLKEAKIDGALLERLGDGMRALGENASQLKSITTVAAISKPST